MLPSSSGQGPLSFKEEIASSNLAGSTTEILATVGDIMATDRYAIGSATFLFVNDENDHVYHTAHKPGLVIKIPELLAAAEMTQVVNGVTIPVCSVYSGMREISTESYPDEVAEINEIISNFLIVKCLDIYAKNTFINDGEHFVCTEEYFFDDEMTED